jgi:putative peptidoglycan lipid II flippase
LNDARTPMIVSLLSIVINYAAASVLIHGTNLGHAGLALSTSSVAIFGSVALFLILRNRIVGVHGRDLLNSAARIAGGSIAMGLAVYASSHLVQSVAGVSRLGYMLDLAISIPTGIVVLYFACRALQVPELEMATRALAGPLARRFRK